MAYRLLYSATCRKLIKNLNPQIKPIVKSKLWTLKEDPFVGKRLERDLSGYWSLRVKRFRIIYRIRERKRMVEIHYVGHRKDIYELFQEALTKEGS
jgi:mRNA interferase RelE/StbE